MKDTFFYSKKTLNIHGRLIDLHTPAVMGILNITPDSFFRGSRAIELPEILEKAERMLNDGATFLDIGGYSSRPGAEDVSVEEERSRVIPALKAILKAHPNALISVDTFRSRIAKEALDLGAAMINDISGGHADPQMYDVVAEYQVPYILMHMKGTPQSMIHENIYDDLMDDLAAYFVEKIALIREKGITDIIIDPGFGFAKNIDQNYLLLKNLSLLKILNLPILAGLSRKSMVYKKLNITPDEALTGSIVLQSMAVLHGASIIRAHDVKEMREAIRLLMYTEEISSK